MSSKTKANSNRAAAALRLAAGALHHSDSALGAFYRRKRAQLGSPKAITAAAQRLIDRLANASVPDRGHPNGEGASATLWEAPVYQIVPSRERCQSQGVAQCRARR